MNLGAILGIAGAVKQLFGGGGKSATPAQGPTGFEPAIRMLPDVLMQIQEDLGRPLDTDEAVSLRSQYDELVRNLAGRLRAGGIPASQAALSRLTAGTGAFAAGLQNVLASQRQARSSRLMTLAQLLSQLATAQGDIVSRANQLAAQENLLRQQRQQEALTTLASILSSMKKQSKPKVVTPSALTSFSPDIYTSKELGQWTNNMWW